MSERKPMPWWVVTILSLMVGWFVLTAVSWLVGSIFLILLTTVVCGLAGVVVLVVGLVQDATK